MRELTPEEMRPAAVGGELSFETTDEVPSLEGLVGQDRAAGAIEFGLRIRSTGFNIFVSGLSGTGRTTSVLSAVRAMAETEPTPDDWCYVHNFANPDEPVAIRLPAGKAVAFRRDMETLVAELRVEIPKAFEAKMYEEVRNSIIKEFQRQKERIFEELERMAKTASFQIQQTPSGVTFVPLIEGKPLADEDIEKLTDHARMEIRKKRELLFEQLTESLRKVREAEKQTRARLADLETQVISGVIEPRFRELKEQYASFKEVLDYLDAVQRDILSNADDFQEKKEVEVLPGLRLGGKDQSLARYAVNVFVDNSSTRGAPVVHELNPTAYNLSGRIEYRPQLGAMVTDFTMIKPGALHRANGGYLIVQAVDLLRNYYAWDTLKRALRNRTILIQDINEQFRLINTPTLKPQPIPAEMKVIVIGTPLIYYLLYTYDDEFRKLFKVRADFSSFMKRDAAGVRNYASFIRRICAEERLPALDREAVGAVLEYGSRLSEHQERLTTRFIAIADLVREAAFLAMSSGGGTVREEHVRRALEAKAYRSNLIEERVRELISEGTIFIDTDGAVVGQVNGLSVSIVGDHAFGRPVRITARVYAGRSGMVNIDRETKLAGTIHNKGFLILSGYMGEKFGAGFPLVFSATICFEQSYDEIEGDSASSAELYALLSALAGVPLRQSVAVTGSVNQKGEIQPVGGVNEKIEGFFAACKAKGKVDGHGVIIPEANRKHLVLKPEVIEACRDGRFHIWTVRTIDEGLEILTGMPGGALLPDGRYPEESVNGRVMARLTALLRAYHRREAGRPKESGKRGLNRFRRKPSQRKQEKGHA